MTQFAMLFPGQGSQSVGMLADLAAAFPVVAETFAEASDALSIDLWSIAQQGPAESLNQTTVTQPVMLAADVAVWRVWSALGGPTPSCLAGHSLGEYAALVAAEALSFADAMQLVARRAQLMQDAVPNGQGAMAAILGLDDEIVEAICREVEQGQVVAPANYNSPGQLVIAGEADAVERAMLRCKDAGAKRAVILPVSVPSHCALMKSIAETFDAALDQASWQTPRIPVIHNVDLSSHDQAPAIRQALAAQLFSPVRWTGTIQAMAERGITRFAECGPGKVLTALGRRIVREAEHRALETPDLIEACKAEWLEN